MKLLLLILAPIVGYVVATLNPAIILSRLIYHKDIRECRSGNPGFTNFKRSFGGKWAWWVLVLDLSKAAVVVWLFSFFLAKYGVDRQLAAAYTGAFCLFGHAYPFLYGFRGGKGFLVCLSTVYVIDWRAGLIATAVMCILLLTTHYMSLSTVTALLLSPSPVYLFGGSLWATLATLALVLFVAIRHHANFKRLLSGTESRFYFGSKKQ
jgi:glycerol-3-phosphate acyltransferase PlsY